MNIYLFNVWMVVERVLSEPELYLLTFATWTFLFSGSDEEYPVEFTALTDPIISTSQRDADVKDIR